MQAATIIASVEEVATVAEYVSLRKLPFMQNAASCTLARTGH